MRIDCGTRELVAIGAAAGATVSVWLAVSVVRSQLRKARLRRSRRLKTTQVQASLATWKQRALEQIAEEDSEAIVSLPFSELQERLHNGQLTAVKVLHAYQRKAAVENEKYNFICEPIAEAEELAQACDRVVDKRSKPLLGIPLSLKENIQLKGYDSTLGLASRAFQPSSESTAVVKVLIEQGAVPFIRTNISQTMLSIDSHNPIYGYTVNPHDPTRSCGGSSGGEGAAIGCWASIVGLGSDLGGSVRLPAAWCGGCALKPAWQRTPWPGVSSSCKGQGIIRSVTGPMARSVDGLVAMSRALFSPEMHSYDPYMANSPFCSEVYNDRRTLRIGYFISDGAVREARSSARAVEEIKAALQKRGHELVPWNVDRIDWAALYLTAKSVVGDGGKMISNALRDEDVSHVIYNTYAIVSVPIWFKKLLLLFARVMLPSHIYRYLDATNGASCVSEWWTLQEQVDEYRREVLESWKKAGLDALICPAVLCPAPPLGEPSKAFGLMRNTFIFNLLNFAAGVVPVTKVCDEDIAHDRRSFSANDMWHRVIKKGLEGSVGLPVAVQCVTLPLHEELCLRLMKEMEECAAESRQAELNATCT